MRLYTIIQHLSFKHANMLMLTKDITKYCYQYTKSLVDKHFQLCAHICMNRSSYAGIQY